jgi:hypothetical protein
MGLKDEEIHGEDYAIRVGGDDVLQTFPKGFATEQYVAKAAELGCELAEFIKHKEFSGCEFFSAQLYKHEGVWKFRPLRFTKHVAKMRTQKLEDLAGAIASHMINYVWETAKFNFFRKMYVDLRKAHPAQFPLHLLKTQRELQYTALGCEAQC